MCGENICIKGTKGDTRHDMIMFSSHLLMLEKTDKGSSLVRPKITSIGKCNTIALLFVNLIAIVPI